MPLVFVCVSVCGISFLHGLVSFIILVILLHECANISCVNITKTVSRSTGLLNVFFKKKYGLSGITNYKIDDISKLVTM